ncbi:MAG: exosortase N [Chitinophagaceae bacterium]
MLLINKRAVFEWCLQPAIGWGFLYLAISTAGLYTYINWASPVFLLGILCLLQVSLPGNSGGTSFRFAYITFAISALSIFLPLRTILYLTGSSAILFTLEANYGKVRHAVFCTLVIMSPIFEYAATVFSFPIRLQLTSWAGNMMAFTGQTVISTGNMITIHGNEFTVDPECMGLNMMETSLLLGVMISCIYQQKFKVRVRFLILVLMLIVISVLNILSNLFRIIAIVQFDIKPGTAIHDIIGITCLLLYVIIPGAALIKVIIKNSDKLLLIYKPIPVKKLKTTTSTGLYLLVTGAILFTVLNTFIHETRKHAFKVPPPYLSGYRVERVDADILKLTDALSLVYIKDIGGFYSTEHNPMICWKGSGYTFKKVEKSIIQGASVYIAVLIKGDEKLYTAWWYDNSKIRTISQFCWRWDAFKGGSNYALINVTCSNYGDLYTNISEIFNTGRLNKLLKN